MNDVYIDPIYRTPVRRGTPYVYREPVSYRRMFDLTPMAPSPRPRRSRSRSAVRRMLQRQRVPLAPIPLNMPFRPRSAIPVPPLPPVARRVKKTPNKKAKKNKKKVSSTEKKVKVLRKMR